jgi:heme/copper-type cytochrome/quinol oxidase subunit 4
MNELDIIEQRLRRIEDATRSSRWSRLTDHLVGLLGGLVISVLLTLDAVVSLINGVFPASASRSLDLNGVGFAPVDYEKQLHFIVILAVFVFLIVVIGLRFLFHKSR